MYYFIVQETKTEKKEINDLVTFKVEKTICKLLQMG